MKKKILFNGLGNRGWIGGLYYIKNIMFSCLQNENIMERFSLVLLIRNMPIFLTVLKKM